MTSEVSVEALDDARRGQGLSGSDFIEDDTPRDGAEETEANLIQQLYRQLLEKTSQYLRSELEGTSEDFHLIQQLNSVTKDKYEELLWSTKKIKDVLGATNERFTCIQPFLDRIDFVEGQVNDLERTIFKLDTYAKQLESRFKALEKR